MTARVLGKLHETLGQGNYYEAHQMFHSVSQRLLKQKKTGEALHLLTAGTQAMLQHGQGGSALDLFERLLEALGAPGTIESLSESRGAFVLSAPPPSLAHTVFLVDRFLGLLCAAPLDSSPGGIARTDIIRLAVKWSTQSHPLGDPQLHHAVGSLYSRGVHPRID